MRYAQGIKERAELDTRVAELKAQGMSHAKIAMALGIGRGRLDGALKRLGLVRPRARLIAESARRAAQLVHAVDVQGVKCGDAAAQLGMSAENAKDILHAHGVRIYLPRGEKRVELVDAIARGWTDDEIAEGFEVTINTVGRWHAILLGINRTREQRNARRRAARAMSNLKGAAEARRQRALRQAQAETQTRTHEGTRDE